MEKERTQEHALSHCIVFNQLILKVNTCQPPCIVQDTNSIVVSCAMQGGWHTQITATIFLFTLIGETFARETFARSKIREIFWINFSELEKLQNFVR